MISIKAMTEVTIDKLIRYRIKKFAVDDTKVLYKIKFCLKYVKNYEQLYKYLALCRKYNNDVIAKHLLVEIEYELFKLKPYNLLGWKYPENKSFSVREMNFDIAKCEGFWFTETKDDRMIALANKMVRYVDHVKCNDCVDSYLEDKTLKKKRYDSIDEAVKYLNACYKYDDSGGSFERESQFIDYHTGDRFDGVKEIDTVKYVGQPLSTKFIKRVLGLKKNKSGGKDMLIRLDYLVKNIIMS